MHAGRMKGLGLVGLWSGLLLAFQSACVVPGGGMGGQSAPSASRTSPKKGLFGLSDARASSSRASSAGSMGLGSGLGNETGEGPDAISQAGAFPSLAAPLTTRGAGADRPFVRAQSRGAGDASLSRSLQSTGELVKVEGNTWRTSLPATRVFALLGRALSQTYILSRVDRRNLSLQTDWDKFFIDGRLFRNRFVVSVFPVGPRQTEVLIRNNLEYFSGAAGQPGSQADGDWLPSPDVTDEVVKLVDGVNLQIQNAALPRTRR